MLVADYALSAERAVAEYFDSRARVRQDGALVGWRPAIATPVRESGYSARVPPFGVFQAFSPSAAVAGAWIWQLASSVIAHRCGYSSRRAFLRPSRVW